MSEPVKIRQLKRKDRRIVVEMIGKMVDKIGSKQILNLIVTDAEAKESKATSKEKDFTFQKIGIEIVKMLLETLENDVAAWFADLIGVKPEEFDEQDFDIEIQIIDQLMAAEESNRFFTGALRLSNSMRELAGKFSTAKKL